MDKLPIISKNNINQLPKMTGVYFFYEKLKIKNQKSKIIYIGKAINIQSRVKNHFQRPSWRDNLFIQKVQKIGFIKTDSEIEALVLESQLIKKHLPKYNVVWKDGKNYFYVAIAQNTQKIPYVFITHQPAKVLSSKYNVLSIGRKRIQNTQYLIPNTQHIGPFVDGNALKKTLKFLRKVFPYYTHLSHPKQKCTWCHLDLCPGPNPDLTDYKKNIKKLTLILQGKSKMVLNSLKREMQAFSKAQSFENAGKTRDKLQALESIMAHTKVIEGQKVENDAWQKTQIKLQEILSPKSPVIRIECYDISNIQGKFATGSMVVFVNGNPDKSQYKKFRIQMKNEPNDIAMLNEVLTRRLARTDWDYPEVMLIDGGIAQLNIAINSKLQITNHKQYQNVKKIKVISIAKGKRELLIEGKAKIPLKDLPQDVYNLIVALDDEAHRFAITYHKKLRKNALLSN